MNSTQCNTHPEPAVVWSAELGQPLAGPPLVVGELLLVPMQEPGPPSQHSTLHTLSLADGSPRWRHSLKYALVSGLAAVQTSEVSETSEVLALVATSSTDLMRGEGALVALDVGGEERWRWAPGVQRVSAPVVAGDVACVTADTRTLLVLSLATGDERAKIELEASASLAAPVVVGDVVYVPCRGPHLLAVSLDGRTRWRFDAEGSSDAWLDKTPVVVGERLFAVLSTGVVLALRAEDGSLAWRVDVGPTGKRLSAPVADGERLYLGARDGLHALDLTDGWEVWHFLTRRRIEAAPLVAGGVVYATCYDHHLYALDAATGRELWRYEVERRIEVSPVVATCGEPAISCVLVADRGGTLVAVACPLSAAEHEAAGHWVEAASAYAALGQFARGAELLEAHDEPFKAAELWKAAGELERAAVQCETAKAWQQAAELWSALGRPLKQAEALEGYARSLEDEPCSREERAEAWTVAAGAFETEGETGRAVACQQEVARCLQQPVITIAVKHEGVVLDAWSRLQFIVRNEGYGPAHKLTIRASGEQFEGQVTATRQIATLRPGRERTDQLDVRPLQHGPSVPLRVSVEYENQAGEACICEQTIYIPVARVEADRGAGQVFHITTALPGTTHVLSFDRLSPMDFERLCLWLAEREGYVRAEHLGLAGGEQGRDVVAYKPTTQGEELWYFQCKRYRSINVKTLTDEVDKYLQLIQEKPDLRPAGVVFVVSCAVSARVREEVSAYCEQHGLAYEFWALTELDMRVKRHSDLLWEFFSLGSPSDRVLTSKPGGEPMAMPQVLPDAKRPVLAISASPAIRQLAALIRARREVGDQPYTLLLGSSLSLTPEVRRAVCDSDDWGAFWTAMERLSAAERRALLAGPLGSLNLSAGYRCLAQLVQARYFDLVLTLNVDDALDESLRIMSAREYHIFTHGQVPGTEIATALSRTHPRVKVVKLRGDINAYKLPLTPEGQFEFPEELEEAVERLLSQDTILVGDIPYDTDIQRCIRKGEGALWVVVPEKPRPGGFLYNAKRACPMGEVITGPEAEFVSFFSALARELGVEI